MTPTACRTIAAMPTPSQQAIVTLDLEGVLVPEIWVAVAEQTGIDALRRTTRDEPDYDALMAYRLEILAENGLTMSRIEQVIAGLSPLPGAADFLTELRATTQVLLLSDTFEQFARPLMAQLGWPTIWCHRLDIVDDRIVGFRRRMPDAKLAAVEALHGLNFRVIAAGDSYNDTSMLLGADTGFLFHAPENVRAEFPGLVALDEYDELLEAITTALTP